jgi:hypothetical protein
VRDLQAGAPMPGLQPRAKSRLVPKLFQAQVGFQQRLLNHVFHVCVGSHFGLHDSLQRSQVRFEQLIE